MPSAILPTISADEIDDLLYLARSNDIHDLKTGVDVLANHQSASPTTIITATIDPDSGNGLLHFASANRCMDVLNYLLPPSTSASTDPNVSNGSSVSTMGLNLDLRNKAGNTPLHWASMNGHLEVVKLLVDRGADVWIKNEAGHNAMFDAEVAGKEEVVAWLLSQQKGVEESGGKEEERAEEAAIHAVDENTADGDSGGGHGMNEDEINKTEYRLKNLEMEEKGD
ncbi:MAG: hypothetical protein Q9218_002736 [Villophora microphyllina]